MKPSNNLNIRINLDALTVMDAIDRRGSFAAAAEELHRVPSAITYAVSKLEQDLGAPLFDRSGHRAVLTAAGRELLQEGRHLLRAASDLECRVKRVATGWEAELRIAVGDLIPQRNLFPLVGQFYEQKGSTRIRLLTEVYGGVWDALASRRADLAIGAPAEGPAGGGYASRPIGRVEFVFCVAPDHPLAGLPEPLTSADILQYRSVSAADSSRNLPPRTSGLLTGQQVLTVPDMRAKYEAQCMGLGVGFLPRFLAEEAVASGLLVTKVVEEHKADIQLAAAWRTGRTGRALSWFLERLQSPDVGAHLLSW